MRPSLDLISTAGIVHDSAGQLKPLNPVQRDVLTRIDSLKRRGKFSAAWHNPWRENLIRGLPNEWHCGAGGRHLYICEDGLVHYCMAQRGYPAIPLEAYTREDIERETKAKKDCAPYCTIFCIQRVALIDRVRDNPRKALEEFFPTKDADGNTRKLPVPIRVLSSLLAPSQSKKENLAQKTALKILKID